MACVHGMCAWHVCVARVQVLLSKELAEGHDTADHPFAQLEPSLVRAVEAALQVAAEERRAWACPAA